MRSLRGPVALALLAASAPLAAPTLAQPAPGEDFRITLAAGAAPRFEGVGVDATLVVNSPDQLEWRLATAKERLLGALVSDGAWPVERPRQLVPEARASGIPDDDWHFFTEVQDVTDSAAWARVTNISAEGKRVAFALAFPVNTTLHEAGLRVTRDTAPPGFTVGPVADLTHFSFYLETTTTEYALANLVIRELPAGEPVPNPTSVFARLQRFPVQGLDADADHAFHVEFTDWAGNTARSPDQRVHTLPRPVLPAPVVTAREPPPNATLAAPVRQVALNFTGPPPRWPGGVAVFIDKLPVHEGVSLGPGRVEVALPRPLGPGPHTVGIELTTPEGGLAVERWGFEVAAPTPLPALTVLAALGLAAASLRRRAS